MNYNNSSSHGKIRIALVTGANRGIGFEIARQLATAKGIKVILTSRTQAKAEPAVKKLAKTNLNVVAEEVDVSDQSSVNRLLRKIKNTYTRIDILVNNAGVLIDKDNQFASNIDLEVAKTIH